MDIIPTTEVDILDFPYVTIGVLTVLEEEYAACKEMFDPDERGHEKQKNASSGL